MIEKKLCRDCNHYRVVEEPKSFTELDGGQVPAKLNLIHYIITHKLCFYNEVGIEAKRNRHKDGDCGPEGTHYDD